MIAGKKCAVQWIRTKLFNSAFINKNVDAIYIYKTMTMFEILNCY